VTHIGQSHRIEREPDSDKPHPVFGGKSRRMKMEKMSLALEMSGSSVTS
jgi:hypothetical protein